MPGRSRADENLREKRFVVIPAEYEVFNRAEMGNFLKILFHFISQAFKNISTFYTVFETFFFAALKL